jgi:hypothetical protein
MFVLVRQRAAHDRIVLVGADHDAADLVFASRSTR